MIIRLSDLGLSRSIMKQSSDKNPEPEEKAPMLPNAMRALLRESVQSTLIEAATAVTCRKFTAIFRISATGLQSVRGSTSSPLLRVAIAASLPAKRPLF